MKKPEVSSDWRKIVRKAWSIRFIALAGLLTAVEAILPFFSDTIPREIFSIATFLAVAGAFMSRILVQKDL